MLCLRHAALFSLNQYSWGERLTMQTMKALVKAKGEEGLWLEEVPLPRPEKTDVLIKILRTAICGTDVHIYNWDSWAQATIPVPMHIGHEFVGVVADDSSGRSA